MSLIFSSGCDSEQVTAGILGYTQVSWDDVSGKTKQPRVEDKTFAELTHEERVAAVALGFTGKTWDNESGKEKQPSTDDKNWSELTACGEYCISTFRMCSPLLSVCHHAFPSHSRSLLGIASDCDNVWNMALVVAYSLALQNNDQTRLLDNRTFEQQLI